MIGAPMFGVGAPSGGVVSLDAFLNRKLLTIKGSDDGELTNHQVRLIVNYGSGSDSGINVYLGSNSKTDFSDIRFTASDGNTALDHYRETPYTSSGSAIFWIEVPTIDSGSTTDTDIYIYYGNSVASTASSGASTFPSLFDDFDNSLTNLIPFGADSGQCTGFDPVTRRIILFSWENSDGNALGYGQWVKVDTWETGILAGHPERVLQSAVAYNPDDQLFYLYGGFDGYTGNYVDTIYTFDPSDDTWTELTEVLTTAVGGATACYDSASGDIFVFGGATGIGGADWAFVDTIWKHDIGANTLTDTTANLSAASWGHGPTLAPNGYIYLFGGAWYDDPTITSLDTIYRYDPANPTTNPTLVAGQTLGAPKDTALIGIKDDDIYIFGGYDYVGTSYSTEIERFNTTSETLFAVTETLDEADDDGFAYYDSVNDTMYVGPLQHSTKSGDDTFKTVIQEFNVDTETLIAEPALGSTPTGWTSEGNDLVVTPVAINKSYLAINDVDATKYIAALMDAFTPLTGKLVVEFGGNWWGEGSGADLWEAGVQIRTTAHPHAFNTSESAMIRQSYAVVGATPFTWSLFKQVGAVATEIPISTVGLGQHVVSQFLDTSAETVSGSVNYGTETARVAFNVLSQPVESIFIHTSTATREGLLIDWIRVRSWTTNEPIPTTWGALETGSWSL